MYFKKNKGFTLVELVVVMSIISLLASIITVNINGYMAKARDARRKADLRNIALALEIYYTSAGHYPIATIWYASCWASPGYNWIPDNGNYNWTGNVLSQQPHDPLDTCSYWSFSNQVTTLAYNYGYLSDTTGQKYILATRLENASDKNTIQYSDPVWWYDGYHLYTQEGWYAGEYVVMHP
jgi:prepilin-type N-terminal cleavage/methylation domain-containing protein